LLRGRIGQAIKLLVDARIKRLESGWLVLFIFMTIYQAVVYFFAIIGLRRKRLRGITLFLLLVIVYFILIPGVVGEARFRVPVEPLLVLLAANGIAHMRVNRRIGASGNRGGQGRK
jgi:hypothetical protein